MSFTTGGVPRGRPQLERGAARPASPDTSTSGRICAQAAASPLCHVQAWEGTPPPPTPVTRGPRLGRPVGRGASRDAASRSPAPAGPASCCARQAGSTTSRGRAHARAGAAAAVAPLCPRPSERGREEEEEEGGARAGEEREGKGTRGGRKGARGRDRVT